MSGFVIGLLSLRQIKISFASIIHKFQWFCSVRRVIGKMDGQKC